MQLIEAILAIQYDSNWGIWAELIDGKFEFGSEARYGQRAFENGGLLDGFVFFCHGETAGNHISKWRDDCGNLVGGWFESLVDSINLELE